MVRRSHAPNPALRDESPFIRSEQMLIMDLPRRIQLMVKSESKHGFSRAKLLVSPDKLKGEPAARRQPGHREDTGSQRPDRRQGDRRSGQSREQGRGRGRGRGRRGQRRGRNNPARNS